MSLTADTDHGVYDAVPVREADQAPEGATHAVFHEDGTLAGFASAAVAWDARRREIGYPATLPGAISLVCERDRPAALAAWPVPRHARAAMAMARRQREDAGECPHVMRIAT